MLRRNLLDHESPTKTIPPQLQRCVQRIVQNVRKQITQQHVDGFDLKDSFGSLHVLCVTNLFSDLMRKHNDPEDAYHFSLFKFVVLGSQVSPERDIVHITFSSYKDCGLKILRNIQGLKILRNIQSDVSHVGPRPILS